MGRGDLMTDFIKRRKMVSFIRDFFTPFCVSGVLLLGDVIVFHLKKSYLFLFSNRIDCWIGHE